MGELLPALYHILKDLDLLVDSRQVHNPIQSCFVALPGKRVHGRQYFPDLAKRGVPYFLLPGHFPEAHQYFDHWPFKQEEIVLLISSETGQASSFALPQVSIVHHKVGTLQNLELIGSLSTDNNLPQYQAYALDLPKDTLLASFAPDLKTVELDPILALLQALAAYHRRQLEVPIIAITGTHGKTIVKDWLSELLSIDRRVFSSPRSYNSQIGLALSVWRIRPLHDIAVIEAGISQSREMARLALISQPNYGIFTTLGEAHRAGFKGEEEQLSEKLLLFKDTDWLLVHYPFLRIHQEIEAIGPEIRSWVHDTSIDYSFMADWQGNLLRSSQLELPLDDLPELPPTYHYNACTALAAAYQLGMTFGQLKQGLQRLQPLSNRLQVRAAPNGCTLIDDSYNNDLTSLAAALDFAEARSQGQAITLFLSDLLQSGQAASQLYATVAKLIKDRVNRLFLVGPNIAALRTLLPDLQLTYFPSFAELRQTLPELVFNQETILIKGARAFGLEQLSDQLLQRRHRTLLEINQEALRHNLAYYRQRLNPGVQVAVMVKASAYGNGDLAVARLLARVRVDYLIVAYTDEGIALREGGISNRIIVLNPSPDQLPLIQQHQLEPVLHNMQLLEAALQQDKSQNLPLHLELDTGMSRLGFSLTTVPVLIKTLQAAGRLQLSSLFSHLAASEDAEQDAFSKQQARRFEAAVEQLKTAGIQVQQRHLLNSNGISRFSEFQFEIVRLGIGLYGVSDATLAEGLRPALRLRTQISAVRDLPAGATISYGRHGSLEKDGRIGVLSIGYADGLPRLAGNGRFSVRIGNQLAPIIGSVCMDMCMIDISHISTAAVGTEVVIFGPEHPIDLLAEAAMTIPYEILTGIGSRVHRVYVEE